MVLRDLCPFCVSLPEGGEITYQFDEVKEVQAYPEGQKKLTGGRLRVELMTGQIREYALDKVSFSRLWFLIAKDSD